MKKLKSTLLVLTCVSVLCTGVISSVAYFTDSSRFVNTFTTAHFEIDLTQPAYTSLPNSAETNIKLNGYKMVQGRVVPTNPRIQNKSTIDAYLFMQIDIPKANVMLVGTAPNITQNAELFSYTIDSNWKLIKTENISGYVRRLYAFKKQVKPNDYTTSLFTSVRYADVVEGQISTVKDIKISAFGIQQPTFTDVDDAYNSYNWNQ